MNSIREALLRGRNRPRNTGSGSPAQYRGDGYEFVELREYVPGDDVRRIDWAATARSNALQTRVVLEDVALTMAAILDDSLSMQAGRTRPLASSAAEAAAAWYGAAEADDRCGRIFADDAVLPAGLRGPRGAQVCLASRSNESFSLIRAFHTAAATLSRGTALLVVSDWFDLDTGEDALLAMLGRRFDCTALIARDPWHDDLPLAGFVTVRDAESQNMRRLFVGARERSRFRTAVLERERDLFERLGAAGWRTGTFGEEDGAASLLRAFGIR